MHLGNSKDITPESNSHSTPLWTMRAAAKQRGFYLLVVWSVLCISCNRSADLEQKEIKVPSTEATIQAGDSTTTSNPKPLDGPLFEELSPQQTGVEFTQRLAL